MLTDFQRENVIEARIQLRCAEELISSAMFRFQTSRRTLGKHPHAKELRALAAKAEESIGEMQAIFSGIERATDE